MMRMLCASWLGMMECMSSPTLWIHLRFALVVVLCGVDFLVLE